MRHRRRPSDCRNSRSGLRGEVGGARKRPDLTLVFLGAYIAVNIGRIHQLIPPLATIRPGLVTGVAAIGLLVARGGVGRAWATIDRWWRFFVVGVASWTLLSIPLSIYAGLSFNMFRDVILQSTALALIVAVTPRSSDDVRFLLKVFVLSAIFYSVMVLWTFGVDLNERLGGLYSYDTNDFAQVVVCALPLALYSAARSKRLLHRAMYSVGSCVFLVVLIKSGSRGGVLGLASVGICGLMVWRAVAWRVRLAWFIGGVLFMSLFGSKMFMQRVTSLMDAKDDYNVTSETGRIQAWKRGIGYMLDNPIVGIGVGAFVTAEGNLSEIAIQARQRGLSVKWMAPHNALVQVGAETGIPGLMLFVGMCWLLVRRTYQLATGGGRALSRGDSMLGSAVLLSLVGFVVTAFFLSQAYSAVLYFMAGIVGALTREEIREA